MSTNQPIRWAPRVQPRAVRRLYAAEARAHATGLPLDAELVNEVGLALLVRCESILLVTAGAVRCPVCATTWTLAAPGQPRRGSSGGNDAPDAAAAQPCGGRGCDWSMSWREYHASWSKRRLYGGNAVTAFQAFADAWPRARGAGRKMVLIDQLLHAFHWDVALNQPNRLAANNLIEGSHAQTLQLLEELSGSPPPAGATRAEFATTLQALRKRRAPPSSRADR